MTRVAEPRELAHLLWEALKYPKKRKERIKQFSDVVWNKTETADEGPEWKVLEDLAMDLEFYEPNRRRRSEDWHFYGDDVLETTIRDGLKRLSAAGVDLPFRIQSVGDEGTRA